MALRRCKGELAAFLDDDDLMMPTRLAKQVRTLYDNQGIITSADAFYMWENPWYAGRFVHGLFTPVRATPATMKAHHFSSYDHALSALELWNATRDSAGIAHIDTHVLADRNIVITSTTMVNLTYIKTRNVYFDETMFVAQDWNLWHRLVKEEKYKYPLLHNAELLGSYDGYEHGRPRKS
jgi:hypothetical protein